MMVVVQIVQRRDVVALVDFAEARKFISTRWTLSVLGIARDSGLAS
jgi:hypothetical protein